MAKGIIDKKTASKFRLELYDVLGKHGIKVGTGELHKDLKAAITNIYDHRIIGTQVVDQKPVEHHVICLQCGKEKKLVGRNAYVQHKKKLERGMRDSEIKSKES